MGSSVDLATASERRISSIDRRSFSVYVGSMDASAQPQRCRCSIDVAIPRVKSKSSSSSSTNVGVRATVYRLEMENKQKNAGMDHSLNLCEVAGPSCKSDAVLAQIQANCRREVC